ncbi:hypothetical protein BH23ACT3_BH23ACT3_06530 [soil metagenome]
MIRCMDVRSDPPHVISCDDCARQCTSQCDDCVVTYFVRRDEADEPLVLDHGQERVVRLLTRAGLIPELQHSLAG